MTAVETAKERWCEADVHRIAGEIVLLSPEPDAAKASVFQSRAHSRTRAGGKILGTARSDERGAAVRDANDKQIAYIYNTWLPMPLLARYSHSTTKLPSH
jgi:hypothetical protein